MRPWSSSYAQESDGRDTGTDRDGTCATATVQMHACTLQGQCKTCSTGLNVSSRSQSQSQVSCLVSKVNQPSRHLSLLIRRRLLPPTVPPRTLTHLAPQSGLGSVTQPDTPACIRPITPPQAASPPDLRIGPDAPHVPRAAAPAGCRYAPAALRRGHPSSPATSPPLPCPVHSTPATAPATVPRRRSHTATNSTTNIS